MKLFIEGKNRSVAYFIPVEKPKTAQGWNVAIAAEDVDGYFPTDWFWEGTYEAAVTLVNASNAKRGISEEEQERIMSSGVIASMRKGVPA